MKCSWAIHNPLMERYHDEEWGTPVHDDQLFFEHLLLDVFQAGLSWQTILNKREQFRAAFDNFDFEKIARYDEKKVLCLLSDKGIIRNRRKIEASVENARRFIVVRERYGSFSNFLWGFTGGKTIHNRFKTIAEIPASTPLSDRISQGFKDHGFRFMGSTICYSIMQATGLVNDHLVTCPRHQELHKH
jgi:DNA-3-methyladenine glycosylase I